MICSLLLIALSNHRRTDVSRLLLHSLDLSVKLSWNSAMPGIAMATFCKHILFQTKRNTHCSTYQYEFFSPLCDTARRQASIRGVFSPTMALAEMRPRKRDVHGKLYKDSILGKPVSRTPNSIHVPDRMDEIHYTCTCMKEYDRAACQ